MKIGINSPMCPHSTRMVRPFLTKMWYNLAVSNTKLVFWKKNDKGHENVKGYVSMDFFLDHPIFVWFWHILLNGKFRMKWAILHVDWNYKAILFYLSPWTKWPPFRRRYIRTNFHEWDFCISIRIHWRLIRRIQLSISQHWFRQRLGAEQATSH